MPDIVDKIIANADVMFAAQKQLQGARVLTNIEKQQAHVDGAGDRCNRCGDLVFGMFPGGVQFCSDCVAHLRALDHADHGGEFWWFSTMLAKIAEGEKANAEKG